HSTIIVTYVLIFPHSLSFCIFPSFLFFFFLLLPRPPSSTLFPYTTLFRSDLDFRRLAWADGAEALVITCGTLVLAILGLRYWALDRKSTRLNSSHVAISYAVFCLKKKKKKVTKLLTGK